MSDKKMTKAQLLTENEILHRKVVKLKKLCLQQKRVKESLHEMCKIYDLFLEHSPIYVFFKGEATGACKTEGPNECFHRPIFS